MPNFSKHILYDPPKPDELEISLFGPGIGECIVIHLGDNEWMIVDSCIESSSKEPAPLVYLNKLGVNHCESVKVFVITHWHSDHICGASKIAEVCASATICFSEALLEQEFITLASIYSGIEQPVLLDRETCATREMSSIIKTIKTRIEQKEPNQSLPFIPTSADKRLYQNKQNAFCKEVWALSPSPKAILNSLRDIGSLIPTPSEIEIRRIVPKPDENHNAIVLYIKYGELLNILLGSDLEETKDEHTGWSVIANSPNRPLNKSKIFKIPHHGSKNAHYHRTWKDMVEDEAIGILTTKIGGKASIPKKSDIKRLKKYAPDLFITLEPSSKKQKYDRVVEKTIKSVLKKRIPLYGEIGQIQIRISKNSQINVRLKEPAKKL